MAKERLTLYDKYGNEVDYDMSTEDVTLDNEGGKSLKQKLAEVDEGIGEQVKKVVFNGTPKNASNGTINLGSQMQADWNESSQQYPSYIKNKPDIVNEISYDPQSRKVKQRRNGVVEDVFTIPEDGSQVTFDETPTAGSDNAVKSKGIKAYVDNHINGLVNGAPAALDTLKELADALADNDDAVAALTNLIGTKANDNEVVKSITVNGQTQTPNNGNVNIEVNSEQGKSAYQSYLDTTSDSPKKSEAEWAASLRGNDGVASGDDVVVVHDTNGEPSNLEQGQVAVLGADLGVAIGKVFNANTQDGNNASPYRLWVGTQQQLDDLDEYEDDVIYLVGTVPVVAQKFNVTFNHTHTNVPSNTPTKAKEGAAFSVTVSPEKDYTIDSATGTMAGGGTLTKTKNQDGSVTFSTSSVTGAITITAVATLYIGSIAISQGTRVGNNIPLTATVNPLNADNVTLEWSIDNTNDFSISGSGASATLTVKSGASNASVNITCQDTNNDSGSAQGTLQLTGLSYEAAPVPITEITDITATRTAANTLQLGVTANGNTPVTYSIVGTAPKSKKLNRTASPFTLDEVDNVALNGNILTYKEDCKVTILATAETENSTVTKQKEITIEHDANDNIWFEDEAMKSVVLGKGIGSNGDVTYADAASATQMRASGNTDIIRFRELMWFTGLTDMGGGANAKINFSGCSNLACVGLPATLKSGGGTTVENNPFYGCALTEVHVASMETIYGITYSTLNASFYSAGKGTGGIHLYINGEEVESIVVPNSVTTMGTGIFAGFSHIKHIDAINISSVGNSPFAGCALVSLKISGSVSSITAGFCSWMTSLESVDLPSGISALPDTTFNHCTALTSVTLRYNGVVSPSINAFKDVTKSNVAIHVPSEQVSAYSSNSNWSGFKSINAITE